MHAVHRLSPWPLCVPPLARWQGRKPEARLRLRPQVPGSPQGASMANHRRSPPLSPPPSPAPPPPPSTASCVVGRRCRACRLQHACTDGRGIRRCLRWCSQHALQARVRCGCVQGDREIDRRRCLRWSQFTGARRMPYCGAFGHPEAQNRLQAGQAGLGVVSGRTGTEQSSTGDSRDL